MPRASGLQSAPPHRRGGPPGIQLEGASHFLSWDRLPEGLWCLDARCMDAPPPGPQGAESPACPVPQGGPSLPTVGAGSGSVLPPHWHRWWPDALSLRLSPRRRTQVRQRGRPTASLEEPTPGSRRTLTSHRSPFFLRAGSDKLSGQGRGRTCQLWDSNATKSNEPVSGEALSLASGRLRIPAITCLSQQATSPAVRGPQS